MYNSNQGIFYQGVQTVSPAGSGDASNGLSVDPVTGDYVLGNGVNEAGAHAQLLSNREIITNSNFIRLKDATQVQTQMIIGNTAAFNITLTSSVAQVNYGLNQGILPLILIRQSDGAINIVQDSAAFNGAQLQVSGTMTSRLLIRSQASGTMTLDRTVDSGKLLTNSNATGLLTIALPSIVLSAYSGFHCYIVVDKNNGIRFSSPDATINISGQTAAAAAFVTSTTVGSAVHLACIAGGTHWHAMSVTGSWTL